MDFKQLIVDSGLKMSQTGLTIETWGNISCIDRVSGRVYLTPSAMPYETVTTNDIAVVTPDGKVIEAHKKPTVETGLHLSIYKHRDDVNAIVHTHPLYSMVFATQGKDIPLVTDEAAQVLGDVCRCAKYALPGSAELAENCVNALGSLSNCCLLHSHGAVCVGADMDAAFKAAKVLEITAQILYMVLAAGGTSAGISAENIAIMRDFAKANGDKNN